MSDFRLNVIAETQKAERSLKAVGRVADEATKARKLNIDVRGLNRNFSDLKKDVEAASNNIKTFYSVTKNIPGVGDKVRQFEELGKNTAATAKEQFRLGTALKDNAQAGGILANTLGTALSTGNRLVDTLAKIGFATFALKEAVGVLQSAWNGFFNNTIGREIKLRETILKTQTTLASTNKVFANGKEITDPYEKIVALTGAVGERIDSIRERSIALAGVTSNEVIEVFGIVASQVGLIGGGLKEAEDLAISFSAALGTFGVPLYQARQEIGSILRGEITEDSYLAKALGIRDEDVERAKTQAGGVTKFLEERLAAAVAGQRIAAEGFSGVVSNIADLGELIGQNFGRGLLDPLLSALSSVFETLFGIREQIFAIASGAGQAIGRAGQLIVGLTAGRTGLGGGDPSKAAAAAAEVAQRGFSELEQVARRTVGALSQAIEALKPTALILVDAFKNIAEAFIRIKVGTFEALASALANIASVVGALAPALASVFNIYARFLNTEGVRYFSEVAAVLGLLKRVGLDAITQLALFGRFIFSSVIPAVGGLGTALGGLIAVVAGLIVSIGKLVVVLAGLATALVGPAAAVPALAAGLRALSVQLLGVGKDAIASGNKLQTLAAGFKGLGAGAKAAGASILASLGWVVAIQVGIAVLVDAFGRFQRAQENQRSTDRAAEALRRLQTTYKDVGNDADSATKSARDFELAIVNAEYDRAIRRLDEVREKLKELKKDAEEFNLIGDFVKLFDVSRIFRSATGRSDFNQRRSLAKEEADLRKQLSEVDAARDREQAKRDIELQANNRANLEREIGDLKRQIDNDLFQQRQALAQKEVDIFRAAGELRIKQIERANAKLIEGEEGASRTALEALNNYIAIRERGELDIEAAKKSLAIEVANLDKAASDYRFNIERKIADLRKKSADYEKNAADQRAAAAGGPAGSLIELIGATESFGGNYGAFNRGGRDGGRTAIGSGIDPNLTNTQISEILRRQTARNVPANQQLFAVGKYQITPDTLKGLLAGKYGETGVKASDKFTPEVQDKLGAALARNRVVPGDIDATIKGLRQEWIGLQNVSDEKLRAAVQPLVGGGAAAPAATTSEIPDSAAAADAYDAAIKGVAGSLERLRSIQEAATQANTAEAFENIAKAAFPQVSLEQYQDRLVELGYTYDAIASGANEVFDPQRSAIEVERLAKIAVSNRELAQIQKGIAEQTKLSEAERQKAISDLVARQAQYVEQLNREAQLKTSILTTEQATNFIRQASQAAQDIQGEIEALQLRNRLQAEGVAPELIQAELAKLQIRREVDLLTKSLNTQLTTEIALRDQLQQRIAAASGPEKEELQRKLNEALATIESLRKQLKGVPEAGREAASAQDRLAAAQTAPGTRIRNFIGDAERELKDYEGLAIRVSQSVGDAVGNSLANGISGLIEGTTTAKEVFANFLRDIGQILLKEGTKIIATYVAIGIAKIFAGFIGGGDGASTAANFELPDPAFIPKGGFGFPGAADGAYFANGRASFAQTSLKPFANGGVVNQPTLFQFANGGATGGGSIPFQMGVMGEAGPEAIMPLSRGSDGRLGVTANIPFTKSASRIASESAERETVTALNNAKPIDVRFESQVINNVEYVTAEEYRKGLAQAAERGRTLTLAALQNSVKTRKRVGIG